MLKIPDKKPVDRANLFLICFAVLLSSILVWWSVNNLFANQDSELTISLVEHGAVTQKLAAYGRLTPRISTSLVAQIDGHISEINVLPGTHVSEDTPIITLVNPQLSRQLLLAQLALQKAQAQYISAKAKLQREATQLANDVAMAESEFKFSNQEIATLGKLHEDKLISDLDFLRANTHLEQLRLKLDLTKRSQAAFEYALQFEEESLLLALESEKQVLAMTEADVANLAVRATQSGILTELTAGVEIGQSVSKGTLLAKLSSQDSLFAQLLAPASASEVLKVGLPVSIAIKGERFGAHIVRIHPNIESNQIKFEATFDGQVPASAVNNLSISADVQLALNPNTLRVNKPIYLKTEQKNQILYVYDGVSIKAKRVEIGLVGNEFIEVLGGLAVGEQVLKTLPESYSTVNI